jgi:hypothetical protein
MYLIFFNIFSGQTLASSCIQTFVYGGHFSRVSETIYQQQHDDHLTSYLTGIETTMYDILCSVHTAIFQLNSHVGRYESRDIVSKHLIGLQSVFARDYVILQDINTILEYFLNVYKVISATMTMQ